MLKALFFGFILLGLLLPWPTDDNEQSASVLKKHPLVYHIFRLLGSNTDCTLAGTGRGRRTTTAF